MAVFCVACRAQGPATLLTPPTDEIRWLQTLCSRRLKVEHKMKQLDCLVLDRAAASALTPRRLSLLPPSPGLLPYVAGTMGQPHDPLPPLSAITNQQPRASQCARSRLSGSLHGGRAWYESAARNGQDWLQLSKMCKGAQPHYFQAYS